MLAAVVGTAGHTDAADIGSLVENGEAALAGKGILELHELHAETQVGLVGAETTHGFVPRHLLQLGQFHASNLPEQMARHVLKEVNHVVLIHETHLAVYLRELRLTVGTQVFVTETFGNLEVAVEPSHHEQLL